MAILSHHWRWLELRDRDGKLLKVPEPMAASAAVVKPLDRDVGAPAVETVWAAMAEKRAADLEALL